MSLGIGFRIGLFGRGGIWRSERCGEAGGAGRSWEEEERRNRKPGK